LVKHSPTYGIVIQDWQLANQIVVRTVFGQSIQE